MEEQTLEAAAAHTEESVQDAAHAEPTSEELAIKATDGAVQAAAAPKRRKTRAQPKHNMARVSGRYIATHGINKYVSTKGRKLLFDIITETIFKPVGLKLYERSSGRVRVSDGVVTLKNGTERRKTREVQPTLSKKFAKRVVAECFADCGKAYSIVRDVE